jgi:hypothetical protein
MRVEQLINSNGNPASNQFIISDENVYIFQSYDTIIAQYNKKDDTVYIDDYVYNGSRTTMKHLYIFLDRYCDILCNRKSDLIDNLDNKDNKSFIVKDLNK